MTRARAKLLQAKVNSLLSSCQFDTSLDGVLLHATTLCIIRYEASTQPHAPKDGEQGAEREAEDAGAAQTGVSGLRTPESLAYQSLWPEDTGVSGPTSGLPQNRALGQSEGPSRGRSGDRPESPA